MNCESVAENLKALTEGTLDREERAACMNHIAACQDCADALRGVRAMLVVRDQATVPGSERIFNRVMSKTSYDPQEQASRKGFWLGAGFSGAIAASLLAVAFALGVSRTAARNMKSLSLLCIGFSMGGSVLRGLMPGNTGIKSQGSLPIMGRRYW